MLKFNSYIYFRLPHARSWATADIELAYTLAVDWNILELDYSQEWKLMSLLLDYPFLAIGMNHFMEIAKMRAEEWFSQIH
jgi:methylmalonyl-CoA mutase